MNEDDALVIDGFIVQRKSTSEPIGYLTHHWQIDAIRRAAEEGISTDASTESDDDE